jgi:hypothetical protein
MHYQRSFFFIFLVMWELKESGIFMGRGDESCTHRHTQHNLYIRTNDVLHTSDLIFGIVAWKKKGWHSYDCVPE